jgi:broad specificity phosphatase PhoE
MDSGPAQAEARLSAMAAATRLRLLCHSATAAVRASAFPADEPIDAQARQRLASPSFRLSRADLCWTSPALRARQTAEGLQLDASVEPMLRDCDYGRWAGRSFDEVQAAEPDAIAEWLRDPACAPHGGESILALIERAAVWLERQSGTLGRVLGVTHAAFIRAAIVHAIGAPPHSFWRIDIAPLSLVRLSGAHGRWTLGSIGRAEGSDNPEDAAS